MINIYLIQKYFMWGGQEKETTAEMQEQIAMALINNAQFLESMRDGDMSDDEIRPNGPLNCVRHPNFM